MKKIWIYKVVCDGGTKGYAMAEEIFGRVVGKLTLKDIAAELKRTIEYGLKSQFNTKPVAIIYKPMCDDIIGVDCRIDSTIERNPLSEKEIEEFRKIFPQGSFQESDRPAFF